MKNILLLIISNFMRNRLAILLSALGGILLCILLFLLGNFVSHETSSKLQIGVIDYDNSALSMDFKSYLAEGLDYQLVENEAYDYLSEMLIDKSISSIIEIPMGFYDTFASGQEGNIIITSTDDFENAAFLEAYMNSYLAGIQLLSTSAEGNKEAFDRNLVEYREMEISITKSLAYSLDKEQFKQREGFGVSIGFFLMIVFPLGMLLSFMIIEDRLNGIYSRITITPVKPIQYIAGNSLFGFMLLMLEVVLYCGFIAIKNIDIGFPVYKLFLLMLLLAFFVTCFILDISILVRSKNGVTTLVMGFSTVGAILGGAYFPLDLAPASLQNLARILPQFWFMDSIRKLMNDPVADITPNIIILVLFTVLAFLIGAVLFSQNYKKG